jgi:DNA end-binding protein Ku
LPLVSSKTIEVLQFVDAEEIDPINFTRSYYLEADGPGGKPYLLMRESLGRTGKVAVVKVALRNRESLALLRPYGDVLLLQMMLWPDEVRAADAFAPSDDVHVRSQEIDMAESYIDTLTAPFDVGEFTDQYREALEEVIEAKAAGRPVKEEEAPVPDRGEVVDLMEALRRSVADAKARRGEDAEPAARKSTAKKAATKSASKPPVKKAASKKTAAKKTAKKAAPARKTA